MSEERQKEKLSVDLILIWVRKGQRTVSEREEKCALKTAILGEREPTHARFRPTGPTRRGPRRQQIAVRTTATDVFSAREGFEQEIGQK